MRIPWLELPRQQPGRPRGRRRAARGARARRGTVVIPSGARSGSPADRHPARPDQVDGVPTEQMLRACSAQVVAAGEHRQRHLLVSDDPRRHARPGPHRDRVPVAADAHRSARCPVGDVERPRRRRATDCRRPSHEQETFGRDGGQPGARGSIGQSVHG